MDDTISRQAAIDTLNKGLDKIPMVNNSVNEMVRRDERILCIDELRALPSAQQWIPVSSGNLPKVRQGVLCQCRAGIQEVLRLTDNGDWECIYPRTIYMKSFVVAWMPLPMPYKGGAEECH